MKANLRCPKCQARVATKDVLSLFSKKEIIICGNCGARLMATFNERMFVFAILSGGCAWFLGLVAAYGAGYQGDATSIASLVGIVAAAIASYRTAFQFSEAH